MSGGSFNYLCTKEVTDLWRGVGEEWDWMLDELDKLCPTASIEMRRIRKSTEEILNEHDARWKKLQPLLLAVEWWRSSDYGIDQVNEAVTEYLESTPK